MELEEVKRFSLAALQYAVDGEYEPAATIVNAIALNGTSRSLYAVCCTWAGSAEVALERIQGPLGQLVLAPRSEFEGVRMLTAWSAAAHPVSREGVTA
ncbi:hypothetical protein [Streptantibioticus silvisoli]|uniref:Uncharacterized protein n=1 Tax=Streptantibioticus silvisoli TaxID=2705255 RepID=A0ABT6W734_9ACTN|nr:hypothetical protein [Streptantibioticus silvisoli]MDI5965792.1 hypothetical protein [Streptantibioticus silvisoli]